ncbi:hypothetical protein J2853_003226 [Streptosporangium lutulentum]|uniref:Uncharacterized protein n=1 Tax=Streptosporangium lutulentum TaxID=1461250 RepID=A0ABT9QB66_9ACTN|nr:hypothetical protein [Streptosporangium lutulentum]
MICTCTCGRWSCQGCRSPRSTAPSSPSRRRRRERSRPADARGRRGTHCTGAVMWSGFGANGIAGTGENNHGWPTTGHVSCAALARPHGSVEFHMDTRAESLFLSHSGCTSITKKASRKRGLVFTGQDVDLDTPPLAVLHLPCAVVGGPIIVGGEIRVEIVMLYQPMRVDSEYADPPSILVVQSASRLFRRFHHPADQCIRPGLPPRRLGRRSSTRARSGACRLSYLRHPNGCVMLNETCLR